MHWHSCILIIFNWRKKGGSHFNIVYFFMQLCIKKSSDFNIFLKSEDSSFCYIIWHAGPSNTSQHPNHRRISVIVWVELYHVSTPTTIPQKGWQAICIAHCISRLAQGGNSSHPFDSVLPTHFSGEDARVAFQNAEELVFGFEQDGVRG